MIPHNIKPHYKMRFQEQNGDNTLITGVLTCCSSNDFEIVVAGKTKYSNFSKMKLYPENDAIVMEGCCKKCWKTIPIFDSNHDGYGQHINQQHTSYSTKPIICKKCQHNSFSVEIKYEYPDVDELNNLEIGEIDNAFTWIWVTLKCNECGFRYKNIINYETG